ncbi:I78 family peptidase inhibitor [Polaromonas sp.]|uniref:I78 family peptidase inhibitor n=1 Tax=Polaromonas sp. TaxID=1869339 RepID=UPI003264D04F
MRALVRIFGLIALAMLLSANGNAQTPDPYEPIEDVVKLYKAGDFYALDKLATKLRIEKNRTPSGRWYLGWFYANLDAAILEGNNTETQWSAVESKLNRWIADCPQSATAPIALATAQESHAWALRGNGFASTVTSEGWEGFAKHMAISRNTLETNKRISSDDPQWYVVMLRVALAQGWKQEKYWALYEEALLKEPLYYGTYFQAAERLIPMWGGSMEEIRDFAKNAVKRTASTEGKGMYARIYWAMSHRIAPAQFLAGSGESATWADMRAGFRDVIKSYPSDFNKNAFAQYACRFGDVDTFLAVFNSFQGRLDDVIWTGNTFQECKEWAAKLRPNRLLTSTGERDLAGIAAVSEPAPSPSSGRCNAAPAQFTLGRNANAALEDEARTRAGAKTVRVLKPGQIVTMEFNAERLSLTVDDAGRVTRVSCG